jgi:hypothetical protein
MKLKAEDIYSLWHQIQEELGDELTLQNPGYGFGICLEARGGQVLASLARPYGKKIEFTPTIRILQAVEEDSNSAGIAIYPYALAALYHHLGAFEWGENEVVEIIRNPDQRSITIQSGPTRAPFRLSCPCAWDFPGPGSQEDRFKDPVALSFVLRHAEMAIGSSLIARCDAYVFPKHRRLLLGDWGLYFSFSIPQHLVESDLSAFTFRFPKYSGWAAAPKSIKIDIKGKTARLEQSRLRAYCETRPIEDPLGKYNITGQPLGLLRIRATDVESQLGKSDQGWVSLSLSEGEVEATVEDEKGDEKSISALGLYNGQSCEMRIAIRHLRRVLKAGFCHFDVHRALPEYALGLYLLGKVRVAQTEARLFEGEQREHPTEVEAFLLPARDDSKPIESETPGKEATP